jgi:hypothetical protein
MNDTNTEARSQVMLRLHEDAIRALQDEVRELRDHVHVLRRSSRAHRAEIDGQRDALLPLLAGLTGFSVGELKERIEIAVLSRRERTDAGKKTPVLRR